jgi:hypothetical protein
MRSITCLLAAATALPVAVAAQNADPDNAVSGGGSVPDGWEVRTDRGTNADQVSFTAMGGGYHVTLGPRTIFYRPSDTQQGSYRVTATLIQTKAPQHPEAFGLFIGGSDLQGDGQSYSYFLIRGTGQFLVKNREGQGTSSVSGGWADHDAIVAQDADGKATNTLSVEVGSDVVTFLINGEEVYSAPASQFRTEGIAGLRANHNLDLHIDGFTVEGI